jgi:hypothetical protein
MVRLSGVWLAAGTGISKKVNFSLMPRADITPIPLVIQRRLHSPIEKFITEDVLGSLSKPDGGVIVGRPTAIDCSSRCNPVLMWNGLSSGA